MSAHRESILGMFRHVLRSEQRRAVRLDWLRAGENLPRVHCADRLATTTHNTDFFQRLPLTAMSSQPRQIQPIAPIK